MLPSRRPETARPRVLETATANTGSSPAGTARVKRTRSAASDSSRADESGANRIRAAMRSFIGSLLPAEDADDAVGARDDERLAVRGERDPGSLAHAGREAVHHLPRRHFPHLD